jgi:hypothetical protein
MMPFSSSSRGSRRTGEVARLFGGGAFGDQRFDSASEIPPAAADGFSTSKTASNIEQLREARREIAGQELAGVEGGVGFAQEFEDGGEGFGGVEIVVHRGAEVGSARRRFGDLR